MSIALLSLPMLFVLIIIEYAMSIFINTKVYRLNDAVANLANAILKRFSNITFDLLFLGVYAILYDKFAIYHFDPLSVYTWALLFVLLDVQYYWHHRFSHRVNFAWAAHSVHHQSEDFNLTVALRMSATQTLVHWSFNLLFAFAGFPPILFLTVYSISTVAMYWYHTRLIKRLGILEYIFMTPSHHRVHHGCDEKYLDRNYGGIFIFWDKIFGTFKSEEEEPRYGTLKPVNSWQPIKCQLAGFSHLAARTRALPRLRDKILVWFLPPDHPNSLDAPNATPDPLSQRDKYDAGAGAVLSVYALIQFVIAATIAIAVFLVAKTTPPPTLVFEAIYLTFSMTCVALIMERGKLQVAAEIVRLVLTPLAILLLPSKILPDSALAATVVFAFQVLALGAAMNHKRVKILLAGVRDKNPVNDQVAG